MSASQRPLRVVARPIDASDPVAAMDAVVDQLLDAYRRGRAVRPDYDQVHVAILQVLDELRGVPQVRRPWCDVTSELLLRWLRAHPRSPFGPICSLPAYREWARELEDGTFSARTLNMLAFEFGAVDHGGNVDLSAFLATVQRWAREQEGAR